MKNFATVICSTCFLLFLSCKKIQNETEIPTQDPQLKTLIDKGFKASDIVSVGDNFVIQGDMVVKKSDVALISSKVYKSKSNNNSMRGTQQADYSYSNPPVTSTQISVYVDPNISANSDWVNAINSAVSEWNNVPNFSIQFAVNITNPSSDIRIINGTNSSLNNSSMDYGIVSSELPINGSPGTTIAIDLNSSNSYSSTYMKLLMIHSFGHTIGIMHTDEYLIGTSIPGTKQCPYQGCNPDPLSVMNMVISSSTSGFTKFDKVAIRYLYPLDQTQTPIYRYYSNARHFYTCNWYELTFGNSSWVYESCEGYIYSNSGNGSRVPVYRYYKSSTGDHIYTINFNELGNGNYGYYRETDLGYAYSYQVSGTVPLYRFRHPTSNQNLHFYTQNYSEGYGWIYEGICCYVLPN